jgi:hypothetical protein
MSGAIPPLPNTTSWRGAQLKHRDNFTIYFTLWYVKHFLKVREMTRIRIGFCRFRLVKSWVKLVLSYAKLGKVIFTKSQREAKRRGNPRNFMKSREVMPLVLESAAAFGAGIAQWCSTGLLGGWSVVRVPQGVGILFITVSSPALGPTHPLIQWVPAALSLGACTEIKNSCSYTSTPSIRLHGVVLRRWTSLHFPLPNSVLFDPIESDKVDLCYVTLSWTSIGSNESDICMLHKRKFPPQSRSRLCFIVRTVERV